MLNSNESVTFGDRDKISNKRFAPRLLTLS
ncbi:hypothetical protein BRAS3843_660048 [Bradyrhizobium sp. STM 3843]|nr:hypothetical protein BRAS3843_660048 [Bradyrhizobium sp. STM 3843]